MTNSRKWFVAGSKGYFYCLFFILPRLFAEILKCYLEIEPLSDSVPVTKNYFVEKSVLSYFYLLIWGLKLLQSNKISIRLNFTKKDLGCFLSLPLLRTKKYKTWIPQLLLLLNLSFLALNCWTWNLYR